MVTVLTLLLSLSAPDADKVYGAPLVSGASKIEEGRFKTSRTYDDTIDFYEKLFKGSQTVRFRKIVNSPQVKATHIMNTASGGSWLGINVYEKDGETRLFFLKAEPKKKSK